MTTQERADFIIKDILVNHLPRIKEGLERGYVDENQILLVYDHAVRARVLREEAGLQPKASTAEALAEVLVEHHDALSRINAELEAEEKPVIAGPEFSPTELINVPSPGIPSGVLKQVPRKLKDEIESGLAVIHARSTLGDDEFWVSGLSDATLGYKSLPTRTADRTKAWVQPLAVAKEWAARWTKMYADIEFTHQAVSDLNWKPHSDQLQCACGGLVKEFPTSVEPLLKCERCERVYTDEAEVFNVRKTETITPQKCPDATYWTTGTLLHGDTPMATEMQINLNGRKATVCGVNGKFVLTYEQIVRMTLFQRNPYGNMLKSDAELPMLTCTYSHRVEFNKLPGERSGSLYKGKSVEATPGMVINCIETGNA